MPLKKPVSPDMTTVKRRHCGCSRIQAAIASGAMAASASWPGRATASSIRRAPISASAAQIAARTSPVCAASLPGPMPTIVTCGRQAKPKRAHRAPMVSESELPVSCAGRPMTSRRAPARLAAAAFS